MQGLGFTTHNVPLVLSGDKDVTRRMIKGVPDGTVRIAHSERKLWSAFDAEGVFLGTCKCRYYPGETVYLREQWLLTGGEVLYRADHPDRECTWATSRFMPENASRQLLSVATIRPERLQAITAQDVLREGLRGVDRGLLRDHFGRSWNEINDSRKGGASWEMDPWVFRIEVQRVQPEKKKNHG